MARVTRWSREQVIAAAPDASSVSAAQKLARPGPWSQAGANDLLVWGQCQGSGKNPYQVSVDLAEPAYRCSCPSRKFPCKHALALLLLWADGHVDSAEALAELGPLVEAFASAELLPGHREAIAIRTRRPR